MIPRTPEACQYFPPAKKPPEYSCLGGELCLFPLNASRKRLLIQRRMILQPLQARTVVAVHQTVRHAVHLARLRVHHLIIAQRRVALLLHLNVHAVRAPLPCVHQAVGRLLPVLAQPLAHTHGLLPLDLTRLHEGFAELQ